MSRSSKPQHVSKCLSDHGFNPRRLGDGGVYTGEGVTVFKNSLGETWAFHVASEPDKNQKEMNVARDMLQLLEREYGCVLNEEARAIMVVER